MSWIIDTFGGLSTKQFSEHLDVNLGAETTIRSTTATACANSHEQEKQRLVLLSCLTVEQPKAKLSHELCGLPFLMYDINLYQKYVEELGNISMAEVLMHFADRI
jgi:hypothetical protein